MKMSKIATGGKWLLLVCAAMAMAAMFVTLALTLTGGATPVSGQGGGNGETPKQPIEIQEVTEPLVPDPWATPTPTLSIQKPPPPADPAPAEEPAGQPQQDRLECNVSFRGPTHITVGTELNYSVTITTSPRATIRNPTWTRTGARTTLLETDPDLRFIRIRAEAAGTITLRATTVCHRSTSGQTQTVNGEGTHTITVVHGTCAGSIVGGSTVVAGQTIGLAWSPSSGTPSTWRWSAGSGLNLTASGSRTFVTGVTAGSRQVDIIVTCTNGGTTTDTHSITVTAATTPSCTGSLSATSSSFKVAETSTIRLTLNTGNTLSSLNSWSLNASLTEVAKTHGQITVRGAVAGIGTATANFTCTNNQSGTASMAVEVLPLDKPLPSLSLAQSGTGPTFSVIASGSWSAVSGATYYRVSATSQALTGDAGLVSTGNRSAYFTQQRTFSWTNGSLSHDDVYGVRLFVAACTGQSANLCGPAADVARSIRIVGPTCDGSIGGPSSVTRGNGITLTWDHTPGQGTPRTYAWTVPSGLSGSSTSSTITIRGVTDGTHTVEIDVTCTNGETAEDTHQITVSSTPCAGSITGATAVDVGSQITLRWSHTSGQGTASTYAWTVPSGLSGSSSTASISVQGVTAGQRTVSISVTCTNGGTATDDHTITVSSTGMPCEGSITGGSTVYVGQTLTLTYTDEDGTANSWSWSVSPSSGLSGSSTSASITLTGVTAGSYTVTADVTCTNGGTYSDDTDVTVRETTYPPPTDLMMVCRQATGDPNNIQIDFSWRRVHNYGRYQYSYRYPRWTGQGYSFAGVRPWTYEGNWGSGPPGELLGHNGGYVESKSIVSGSTSFTIRAMIRTFERVENADDRIVPVYGPWSEEVRLTMTPETCGVTVSALDVAVTEFEVTTDRSAFNPVSNPITPGHGYWMQVTVENLGTAPAHQSSLRYYRSNDATIDTGDTEIDRETIHNGLTAGQEKEYEEQTTPGDIPATGAYYYGACVPLHAGDVDPANNCSDGVLLYPAGTTLCGGSIGGQSSVVRGSTITLNWNHTSGQGTASTYAWSETSTRISISGSSTGSSVTIQGVSAGVGRVSISVTCTNGATATDIHDVTVTLPAQCEGAITGQTTVVRNNRLTLRWSHTSGAGTPQTYQWSESSLAISLPLGTTGSSVVVSGDVIGSGTVSITVTCSNGETATDTHTVRVTAPLCDGNITGPTTVQRPNRITLRWSHTTGQGTPSTYSWSEFTERISFVGSATGSSVSVRGDRPGQATVSISVSCSAGGTATDTHTITVTGTTPMPCAGSITGPSSVVVGSTINLSWSHTSGQGTPSTYNWSDNGSPNVSFTTLISRTPITVRGDRTGNATVSIAVTCSNGGTANDSHTLTVTGQTGCTVDVTWTPSTITSPADSLLRYTITGPYTSRSNTSSRTGTVGRTWAGWTGDPATGRSNRGTFTGSGTYTYSLTAQCSDGTSHTDSATLTVNAPTANCSGAIQGVSTVAQNTNISLQWFRNAGTPQTYTWRFDRPDNTGGGRSGSPISFNSGTATGNIHVTVSVTCTNGGTARDTHNITVTGPPCGGRITGPTSVDRGSTVRLSFTMEPGEGIASSWRWSESSSAISISGSSTGANATIRGDSAGSGTVSIAVTCTNGGSASDTHTVRVNAPTCAGSIRLSSSQTVNGVTNGRVTLQWRHSSGQGTPQRYRWSVPSGFSGSSSTATIVLTASRSASGTVSITVTCTNGETATDTYHLSASGQCSGSITGPTSVEVNGSITLRWSHRAGTASRYSWSTSDSSILFGGGGGISTSWDGERAGTVTVTAIAYCTNGEDATDTHRVSVRAGVCRGSIDGPSTVALTGLSHSLNWTHTQGNPIDYRWTLTGDISGSSATGSIDLTVTTPFSSGRASIEVECDNGGVATDAVSFTLSGCIAIIDGPTQMRPNATATFRDTNPNGSNVKWLWEVSGGLTIQGDPATARLQSSITVQTPSDYTGGGTVRMYVWTNVAQLACANTTRVIALQPPPCDGEIEGPATVQLTGPTHTVRWRQTQGTADTYVWTLDTNISGTSTTATIDVTIISPFTSGQVSVLVTCTADEFGYQATVTDSVTLRLPSCIAVISGPDEIQPGGRGTYRDANLNGNNVKWFWNLTGGLDFDRTTAGAVAHLQNNVTVVAPANFTSGTVTMHVWISGTGFACASATKTVTAPSSPCAGMITGPSTLSRGQTLTLNWSHTSGQGTASSYRWTLTGAGWSIISGATFSQVRIRADSTTWNGGTVNIAVTCSNGGDTSDMHPVARGPDITSPCAGNITGPDRMGLSQSGQFNWSHTTGAGTPILWSWSHSPSGAFTGASSTPVLNVTTSATFSGGTIAITVTCSNGRQALDTHDVGTLAVPPSPTGVECTATLTAIRVRWDRIPDATFEGASLRAFDYWLQHPSGATTLRRTNRFGSSDTFTGRFVSNAKYKIFVVAIYGTNSRSLAAMGMCMTPERPGLQNVVAGQLTPGELTPGLAGYRGQAGVTVTVTVKADRPLFAVAMSPSGREVISLDNACDFDPDTGDTVSLLAGDSMGVVLCAPGQAAVSLYDAWTGLLMQDYWPITVDP